MAAPSSNVPAVATGPCPKNADVDVLTYVEEFVAGAALLLQQVPVVGDVCATFLSFQELVETARGNKEDLANLRELCDVVIKGALEQNSDRLGLFQGFVALEKHVKKAEEVAKLCSGVGVTKSAKRFVLSRKISKEIAVISNNIVSLCAANTLAFAEDTRVSTR